MSKNKKGNTAIKVILIIVLVLLLAVCAFAGYKLISYFAESSQASAGYNEIKNEVIQSEPSTESGTENTNEKKIDWAALQSKYPQIKAWIVCEGTEIDYPVVQADNNEYYLTHLYNDEYNVNGSIFMDYRCNPDFSERNTVIYGHHMNNGQMFAALYSYTEQSFYDQHKTMQLYTPNGNYTLELVCGTAQNGYDNFIQLNFANDEAFLEYMDDFLLRSTFRSDVKISGSDRIVSLCTCSNDWSNGRYLVIARLVEGV